MQFTKTSTSVQLEGHRLQHWIVGQTTDVLDHIHDSHVSMAIQERNQSVDTAEINHFLKQNLEVRASGSIDAIMVEVMSTLDPTIFKTLMKDLSATLTRFDEIMEVAEYRLLLASINTNMCRRFHTDINDVRLLCTYTGPGTLWLTNDNINRRALDSYDGNESIVIDPELIQQVPEGAIALLKGAMYPHHQTKAIVHRSPTIEESGEKRLLLRIDTNATTKVWN